MDTGFITNLIGGVSKDLTQMISDAGILLFIISVFSILIVYSIRKSYEDSLKKLKLSEKELWYINLITIIIISAQVLFIFVIKNDSFLFQIFRWFNYYLLLVFISWSMSILLYELVIKAFFDLLHTVKNMARTKRLDSETDMVRQELLLSEQYSLLKEKIIQSEYEKIVKETNDSLESEDDKVKE